MVNWRNPTFEYYWHVLAAFGIDRVGCQAEIRQQASLNWEGAAGFLGTAPVTDTVFMTGSI